MRLTREKRDAIRRKVVSTAFEPRKAALKEQDAALQRTLRAHYLDEKQAALMDKLDSMDPKCFSAHIRRSFKADLPGYNFYQTVTFSVVPVPYGWSNGTALVTSPDVAAAIDSYIEAERTYESDRQSYSDETIGVLATFSDAKKLLHHWPALRELMGDDFFRDVPKVVNLPVKSINSLNDVLSAAMKVAA